MNVDTGAFRALSDRAAAADAHRGGEARRAPGSGSRARSREIGYAEAMGEMGFLLRDEARKWKNTADQQIVPFAGAALTVAADSLEQLADFALGAYSLHVDPGRGFARDAEHRDWLEREGYVPAGPRELPGSHQGGRQ